MAEGDLISRGPSLRTCGPYALDPRRCRRFYAISRAGNGRMPSVRAEFDPSLESLRGIAALSVANSHSLGVFVDPPDAGPIHQWTWQVFSTLATVFPAGGG